MARPVNSDRSEGYFPNLTNAIEGQLRALATSGRMTEVSSAPSQLLPGRNYQATNNSGDIVTATATQRGTLLAATRDSQMGFGWVNTTAPTTVTMTQSGLGSRMAIDSTSVRAGLPYSQMGGGLYPDRMSGIGYYPSCTPSHARPYPTHVGPMSCGATHGAHTAGLGIPALGQICYPPTYPMGHYYVGSGPSSGPGSGSGTRGGDGSPIDAIVTEPK